MKKFLSLVLALVMTMSLVTISAGAKDFTDKDSLTYEEPVQVMSLLGVINGYEDGSFKPANTLTRGAAAKIICNLLLTPSVADTLPANNTGFKDVPTTNTFAKYIAYCANAKIINGYSDGTFRPAATLTGYAYLKMLLGALGYDAQIEGFTGDTFAMNVASKAGQLKLTAGNDTFVGTKAVTREEACLYAFNMLDCAMVEYASKGSKITVNGVEIIQGASPATSIKDKDGKAITFQSVKFPGLKSETTTDIYGRKVTTWTYGKKEVTFNAVNADAVYYGSVSGKDLFNDLKLGKTTKYDLVNGKGAQAVEKTGAEIRDLKDNGVAVDFGGINTVVEVYYTAAKAATKDAAAQNAKIEIVRVPYGVTTIDRVYKATSTDDRYVTLTATGAAKYYTENFAKGDVVLYTATKDTNNKWDIYTVQLAKSVEGKITGIRGDKATINGVNYRIDKSASTLTGVKAGWEGTFYLGVDNTAVYFSGKKTVASADNFAYIYNVVESGAGYEGGVYTDGVKTAYFVKADGTMDKAVVAEDHAKATEIVAGAVIPYLLNADGKMEVATYDDAALKVKDHLTGAKVPFGKSRNAVDGTYMDATTKFVFVDVTKNDAGKVTKVKANIVTGYKNVADDTQNLFVVADKSGKALVIFVAAAETNLTENAAFLLNETPFETLNAKGETIYEFDVMISGEEKATTLTSKTADIFKNKVAEGDRFTYELADGILKADSIVKTTEGVFDGYTVTYVGDGFVALEKKGAASQVFNFADKYLTYLGEDFSFTDLKVDDVVTVYTKTVDSKTVATTFVISDRG